MRRAKLTGRFGVEISGVDLSDPDLSSVPFDEIRTCLNTCGLVVFRNQHNMTKSQLLDFARQFGVPEFAPAGNANHPHILTIRHDEIAPATENVWHSDQSFRDRPPMGAVLRAVVLPDAGGDTVFADMRLAYGSVAPSIKALVEDLVAEHDVAKWAPPNLKRSLVGPQSRHTHPIVRVHPETGDPILYVNEGYTTLIPSLSADESRALLSYLFSVVSKPENQCRLKWSAGTVVVWDNRSLQHYAVGDYYPAVRIMDRVSIAGDRPVGRCRAKDA